jgi:transcriptional regulator with XRE-family HTH domain
MGALEGIIGANVRRLRKERALTQEDVAHRAEISVRYLSSVEAGHQNVTIAVLERLAVVLGVSAASLLVGQEIL